MRLDYLSAILFIIIIILKTDLIEVFKSTIPLHTKKQLKLNYFVCTDLYVISQLSFHFHIRNDKIFISIYMFS